MEGYLRLRFGGLIFGRAYYQNFRVIFLIYGRLRPGIDSGVCATIDFTGKWRVSDESASNKAVFQIREGSQVKSPRKLTT